MQATLLATNFHASSDSIESQSKFMVFLQRLIVVQQVKISLIWNGHLKMHVPKPVMGLCVCVERIGCWQYNFKKGTSWTLCNRLINRPLMYCHCRNLLLSR